MNHKLNAPAISNAQFTYEDKTGSDKKMEK